MKAFLISIVLAATAATSAAAQYRMTSPAYGYMSSPGLVVEHGQIIGMDPDPNVRLQLRREALIGEGVGSPY